MAEATGTFDITLTPSAGLIEESARFDFTKIWSGGLAGAGRGVMLSAGDPRTGTAGYVALERFDGSLDGRVGSFCFQQFGTMSAGQQILDYVITPGSGTEDLAGIVGVMHLSIDADGTHRYRLSYDIGSVETTS